MSPCVYTIEHDNAECIISKIFYIFVQDVSTSSDEESSENHSFKRFRPIEPAPRTVSVVYRQTPTFANMDNVV